MVKSHENDRAELPKPYKPYTDLLALRVQVPNDHFLPSTTTYLTKYYDKPEYLIIGSSETLKSGSTGRRAPDLNGYHIIYCYFTVLYVAFGV